MYFQYSLHHFNSKLKRGNGDGVGCMNGTHNYVMHGSKKCLVFVCVGKNIIRLPLQVLAKHHLRCSFLSLTSQDLQRCRCKGRVLVLNMYLCTIRDGCCSMYVAITHQISVYLNKFIFVFLGACFASENNQIICCFLEIELSVFHSFSIF